MNNNTNQNITEINLSALSKINNIISSKIEQKGSIESRLLIESNFDGYWSLMYDINILVETIEGLALHSCLPDAERLKSISVISGLIQKILPTNDVALLDELLIFNNTQKNSIVSIEDIQEQFK